MLKYLFAAYIAISIVATYILLLMVSPSKESVIDYSFCVAKYQNRDVFSIDGSNYSPTGKVHALNIDINYTHNAIFIYRLKIIWLPKIQGILYNRLPIIVDDGLLPGAYTVNAWDGDAYVTIGRLSVSQDRLMVFDKFENNE